MKGLLHAGGGVRCEERGAWVGKLLHKYGDTSHSKWPSQLGGGKGQATVGPLRGAVDGCDLVQQVVQKADADVPQNGQHRLQEEQKVNTDA